MNTVRKKICITSINYHYHFVKILVTLDLNTDNITESGAEYLAIGLQSNTVRRFYLCTSITHAWSLIYTDTWNVEPWKQQDWWWWYKTFDERIENEQSEGTSEQWDRTHFSSSCYTDVDNSEPCKMPIWGWRGTAFSKCFTWKYGAITFALF